MTSRIFLSTGLLWLAACASQGSPSSTASSSPFAPGIPSDINSNFPLAPLPPPTASGITVKPAPDKPPKASPEAVIGTAEKYKQDPTVAPTSCADVGNHVGYASCCQGKYCAGFCDPQKGCSCGNNSGCLWPEVCGTSCGGPQAAVVYLKEPDGTTKVVRALSGEPAMTPGYIGEAKIVEEGDTCGLPTPKTTEEQILKKADHRRWSCCQGKKCPGYCVTRPTDPTPHCECAGLKGGCVAPHICCGETYPWASCEDEKSCPSELN